MKRISRGAQIITADSRQWNLTKNSYSPGGALTIMFERCRPFVDEKTMKIGRLGNWSATSLQHEGKRLKLINLCRTPASSSCGPNCTATQHVTADRNIKSLVTCRKEIFKEIKSM